MSNLFTDIFTKYLGIGKTTYAFYKLGMHPRTEGMFFLKLFRMDNRTVSVNFSGVVRGRLEKKE